jgi:hypothetical protein
VLLRGDEVVRSSAFAADVDLLRPNFPDIDRVVTDFSDALRLLARNAAHRPVRASLNIYAIRADYPPHGDPPWRVLGDLSCVACGTATPQTPARVHVADDHGLNHATVARNGRYVHMSNRPRRVGSWLRCSSCSAACGWTRSP